MANSSLDRLMAQVSKKPNVINIIEQFLLNKNFSAFQHLLCFPRFSVKAEHNSLSVKSGN
jgi:hypothetical protein